MKDHKELKVVAVNTDLAGSSSNGKYCLQEFDQDGQKIDFDWHPASKSYFYFKVFDFHIHEDIERDLSKSDPWESSNANITATLEPGDQGRFHEFSVFGTERKISKMSVTYYSTEDVSGRVSISASRKWEEEEGDIFGHSGEDSLHLAIGLVTKEFNRLFDSLRRNAVQNAQLTISGVTGFYTTDPYESGFAMGLVKALPSPLDVEVEEDDITVLSCSTIGNFKIEWSEKVGAPQQDDHIEKTKAKKNLHNRPPSYRFAPKIFRDETQYEYPFAQIGSEVLEIYEALGFFNSEEDKPETVCNDIFVELLEDALADYKESLDLDLGRIKDRLSAVQDIAFLLAEYYPESWFNDPRKSWYAYIEDYNPGKIQSIFYQGGDALPTISYNTMSAEEAIKIYIAKGLHSKAFENFLIRICVFIPSIDYAYNLSRGERPGLSAYSQGISVMPLSHQKEGYNEFKNDTRFGTLGHLLWLWVLGLSAGYLGFQSFGGMENILQSSIAGVLSCFALFAINRIGFLLPLPGKNFDEGKREIEDDARHLFALNERSFLTSPQQALDHINDMRLRGFYFPVNLENLLVHMIENQRNSRELVAIYNNDGRSMPPRI